MKTYSDTETYTKDYILNKNLFDIFETPVVKAMSKYITTLEDKLRKTGKIISELNIKLKEGIR